MSEVKLEDLYVIVWMAYDHILSQDLFLYEDEARAREELLNTDGETTPVLYRLVKWPPEPQ